MDTSVAATASNFIGSTTILIYCGCAFYGILCAQTYEYVCNFPNDAKMLKVATAALLILETLHTALMIISLYLYTISSAVNPLLVLKISWNTGVICIVEVAIVLIVQGYYIRRVWILSAGRKRLALTVILCSLVATRCGFESATAVYIWLPATNTWTSFHDTRASFLCYSGWLAFAAIGDVGIAAVLCFFLWERRTAIRTTNSIIRRTMAFTLNSGALTALVALAGLVTFFVSDTLTNTGILVIASKLYANSFLGMLNARQLTRREEVRFMREIDWSLLHRNTADPRPRPEDSVILIGIRKNSTLMI